MKNVILTVGGILLAAAIVTGFYLGTLKTAANGAAATANGWINNVTTAGNSFDFNK